LRIFSNWKRAQSRATSTHSAGHDGPVRRGRPDCRDADGFLTERAGVTSPMLKVKLFGQGLAWTERLQALQAKWTRWARPGRGTSRDERHLGRGAGGRSGRVASLPLGRLEEVYRVLSYIARWSEQIRERMVRLASG
jgi:hypothetical protein